MGSKGVSTTLKRKPAPKFWPLHKKEVTFAVNPASGAHSREKCLPLAIVLRDVLKLGKTRKEIKKTVSDGKVLVDKKKVFSDSFAVGLADLIEIPDAGMSYRLIPSQKGLMLQPVREQESNFKLCRIEDKKVLRNGNVQLNLHDGSNLLVKVTDAKNPQEDVYETLDTLRISLPDKHILEHIKMKQKDFAVITSGKNAGKYGRISELETSEGKRRRDALVTIDDGRGNKYQTILDFVFALGETNSVISLPEAA